MLKVQGTSFEVVMPEGSYLSENILGEIDEGQMRCFQVSVQQEMLLLHSRIVV
jgi:hypothetical protein